MMRSELPAEGGYIVLPRAWSLAMLVGMIGQAAVLVWYAAKLDSRVAYLEESRARVELRLDGFVLERDRITRLEAQVAQQTELLRRIERKLDAGQ